MNALAVEGLREAEKIMRKQGHTRSRKEYFVLGSKPVKQTDLPPDDYRQAIKKCRVCVLGGLILGLGTTPLEAARGYDDVSVAYDVAKQALVKATGQVQVMELAQDWNEKASGKDCIKAYRAARKLIEKGVVQ